MRVDTTISILFQHYWIWEHAVKVVTTANSTPKQLITANPAVSQSVPPFDINKSQSTPRPLTLLTVHLHPSTSNTTCILFLSPNTNRLAILGLKKKLTLAFVMFSGCCITIKHQSRTSSHVLTCTPIIVKRLQLRNST